MFSKQAIQTAIQKQLLMIEPFDENQIEKAHINLHIELPDEQLVIAPKGFVLASTVEKITLAESLCGRVEGKASLAKLGLSVEQSSTFLEPGTDNKITLELFNASDKEVIVRVGQEIAKMFVMKVVDEI